ncbi:MAG: hypothetical protein LUD01_01165, partial [Clostridiales bacterium]|nr:hypothetical protein [Clostridiales bacterium]
NQTREEAETTFLELLQNKLSEKADFTAIFCANDSTAIRVLALLHAQKKPCGNPSPSTMWRNPRKPARC